MDDMFQKVLIANRGAIAARVERTLKKMNIRSVAVYTKADQDSLHVDMADEAVYLGEGSARDTYLDEEKILEAALQTGAQAIHPGYGFLSENTEFAKRCEEKGIRFIGPTTRQIELFGLKHCARDIAEKAQVPLLPGTGLLSDVEEAVEAGEKIGYPVILKSTAGGGGIGMKVCESSEELRSAYDSVCHLASANFGNGGVFVEKYIRRARHIEIQIFGNEYGEAVALTERDCSVQRRNQKVVEETPAPGFPPAVREKMQKAAVRLAKEIGYRSAGTVEFLYDEQAQEFYFLEVNTRLQVEHGITEEIHGIDLVEWMVLEAAGELKGLEQLWKEQLSAPKGHSIEVRVYAEDCLNQFRPGTGKVDKVEWPEETRVETWIRDGIEVTSLYDPMLAKLIVHGKDRTEAIQKMQKTLAAARVYGVTTNLQYLEALFKTEAYRAGQLFTGMLNDFLPEESALEVLDGGIQTTVQDYPGRCGHWDVGVPPCGPMDSYSFRLANAILGNEDDAPALEMTLKGGSYRFRTETVIAIAGADMEAALDGEKIPMNTAVRVKPMQVLCFGEAKQGMRTYLAVKGGLDMPLILGSASTFTLGKFGGHNGRALRTGDVLRIREEKAGAGESTLQEAAAKTGGQKADRQQAAGEGFSLEENLREEMTNSWTIGVIIGPHSTEDFLKPSYIETLANTEYKVNFNSNRTGIRLNGPVPEWTREDGGEAGLHPSNLHDNAYAIGAMDLTGDQSIMLGPDGPSLGGFVCPVVTASSELWKLGQLHPGDSVHFRIVTLEEARELRMEQEKFLETVRQGVQPQTKRRELAGGNPEQISPQSAILYQAGKGQDKLTLRLSGDEYLLIEYGEMELDLILRFRIHVLMNAVKEKAHFPIIDMTPGIRSLQIHIDGTRYDVRRLAEEIVEIDRNLPELKDITVPSRIVKLPLSWDDPSTQLAAKRYQTTVRPNAPWCPSNLEFIRRINGLDSIEDVKKIFFDASYLVLGLGDVYLGAPVATPVDPRHRLVTTKYNPARPWTPENAVGIGGAYLCVYGMEGPGGYQFVGRTVQMWNPLRSTDSFLPGKPWLLNFFDQLQFYPVSAEELLKLREDFLRNRFNVEIEETTFHLGEYLEFLEDIKDSAHAFKEHQEAAFLAERQRWKEQGLDEFISEEPEISTQEEEAIPEGCQAVRATIPGSVWKVTGREQEPVKAKEPVVILESMKMEFPIEAQEDGVIEKIYVKPGEGVAAGQLVACIKKK